MLKFELTILGSNSAMPANGRWPTSQILAVKDELILLDAGEGCQIRMAEYKIKKNKISYVLISHLHGDHIYGLPGFLGSLSHLSRSKPLYLFGPVGIKEYIETLTRLSQGHLSYPLVITELENSQALEIVDNGKYTITAFPVNHRLPTYGYHIKEKGAERNIRKEKIAEYQMEVKDILAVKAGADLTREQGIIPNDQLTHPMLKNRSYAYCADSTKDGWNKEGLQGADILYFETTYLHELVELAHERKHATAREAAELAKELKVGKLVIGHYSSRYRDIEPLYQEAKAVFENVFKGYDGFILNI